MPKVSDTDWPRPEEIGTSNTHEGSLMSQHIGCDFDDFLVEQGLAEEVSAIALRRVIAWAAD